MSALVTILCLLSVALLGLALASRMRRRGQTAAACAVAAGLCIVNPLTWEAITLGHPEELLGGALCVGVVLAALRRHAVGAALVLGLALGTMSTVWTETLHPAVVLPAVPLTAWWWSSKRRTPDDVLALLALLFLLCSLLDPAGDAYQHVPFLLSLVAWEGLTRRGPPVVSVLSAVAISYAPLATIPVGIWLAVRLYAPARLARVPVSRPWPYPGRRVSAWPSE